MNEEHGNNHQRVAFRLTSFCSLTLLGCFVALIASPTSTQAQETGCDGAGVTKSVLTTLDGVSIATYSQGPQDAKATPGSNSQGTTAIVLVHQVNQDHCGWSAEAASLAKKYRVMSIDLRGYGTSQRAKGTTAFAYRNDIAAAVNALRTKGAGKVVLVGASMGGSAVVVAGAFIDPPVAGIVAVSAPTNFKGQNAKTAAPKLRIPARFLAASDDGAAVSSAKSLDRGAVNSPNHQAVVFATGGHGWALVRPGSPAETTLTEFVDAL
jgi:pimeloyl-ACP methyl ester carboxylesterase